MHMSVAAQQDVMKAPVRLYLFRRASRLPRGHRFLRTVFFFAVVFRVALPRTFLRPHRVVLPPPSLDQDLCFGERVEDLAVQQFIAQLPVERFHIAVLPGTSRFDEQRLDGEGGQPVPHERRRELRPVV